MTKTVRPRWAAQRDGLLHAFRQDALAPFLAGNDVLELPNAAAAQTIAADGAQGTLFAPFLLQDVADYRATLQRWFGAVREGGFLVIVVPHAFLYERQYSLPSRWNPGQRRLYTPRSLLEEVEEALEPNSYRVRHLGDRDEGYDYATDPEIEPTGASDIVLALQKIASPRWTLQPFPARDTRRGIAPDYAFAPGRTRVEFTAPRKRSRILILKLDHLGDFIMGVEALRRARALFAESEITLVVGAWNRAMAEELGLADRVIEFNAFPRNSSEEEVDVPGKVALFQALMTEEYDLAIDLRSDHDTRFLLRHVRAPLRAGIGTAARFPFLDIFLPVDDTRGPPEAVHEEVFNHFAFASDHRARRGSFRIQSAPDVGRGHAVIWGPYRWLRPGRYVFEPFLEIEPDSAGLVRLDMAVNATPLVERLVSRPGPVKLAFTVEEEGDFEFRVWSESDPPLRFEFFGGRIIRQGSASVLHQSEYLLLLIELVALRVDRTGVLGERGAA